LYHYYYYYYYNAIAQRSGELVSRYSGDLDMTLTDEFRKVKKLILTFYIPDRKATTGIGKVFSAPLC